MRSLDVVIAKREKRKCDRPFFAVLAHLIGHIVAVVVIRCLMMLRNAQRQIEVVVPLQQTEIEII